MALLKGDFPYPVLLPDNDDYVEGCSFSFSLGEGFVDGDSIIVPVSYELGSDLLSSLCVNGEASAAVRAVSSAVSFSRLIPFPKGESSLDVEIHKLDVKDKIELECLIVAAAPIIIDGGSSDLNQFYEFQNTQFKLDKGDILAQSLTCTVYLDDSELEKPLRSIFSINEKKDFQSGLLPSYDQQKIVIDICPDLYRLYYDYAYKNGGTMERFANGAIVFPVLVDAINLMLNRERDENDARWCRSIISKCEKLSIDFYSGEVNAVTLADKLLGGIALGCMKAFDEGANTGANSGELIEERSTD